ncbi:CBS domain-containing protein [Sphingomonas lycopersici]|uniref:CBS domain-containing protein n=1 Tax=Sphingomonas lycopersici TaxID=2951807 RepID=A0AA42CNC5_9SPHN|nr:CBS domain-containing protein [Sphingomonas lycopersici]MCW6533209.1 CBS domain-containing protein [Sphingomonas lycopersici]
MRVRECMTTDVQVITPDNTLQSAAQIMADIDAGFLPVADHDRLVGVITDRDIAIRGVAAGHPPDSSIRDLMSGSVKYCFDDDDLDDVLENMGDIQLHRLAVINRDKRLVGVITIGDCAGGGETARAGEALGDIVRHGARTSQMV